MAAPLNARQRTRSCTRPPTALHVPTRPATRCPPPCKCPHHPHCRYRSAACPAHLDLWELADQGCHVLHRLWVPHLDGGVARVVALLSEGQGGRCVRRVRRVRDGAARRRARNKRAASPRRAWKLDSWYGRPQPSKELSGSMRHFQSAADAAPTPSSSRARRARRRRVVAMAMGWGSLLTGWGMREM